MLEMEIHSVNLDVMSSQPVVVLKEKDARRFLPIWIGQFEATAIMMEMQGMQPSRPLTHDLLRTMIDVLGAQVHRIVVSDIQDGTFYAVIQLTSNGDRIDVDARPSDAIALAVRLGAPIFASEEVLERAAIVQDEEDETEEIERFKQFIDSVEPEDFGLG